MNRRLQNTFTALMASASALALCLAMAMPAQQKARSAEPVALNLGALEFTFTPTDASASRGKQVDDLVRSIETRYDRVDSVADAATLAAEIATAAALARTLHEAGETSAIDTETKQARKAARHRRQTLVMPYFSFAPRG